jgi:hypothetical protein
MSSFLVLWIYLLLLVPDDGKGMGWIRFLRDDSDEDEGYNYDVSNFLDMTTWRLRFPNSDIKAEMLLSPWNYFLLSILCFVIVRSDHNEGPVRISISVFLIFSWQKEKEGRYKKEEVS